MDELKLKVRYREVYYIGFLFFAEGSRALIFALIWALNCFNGFYIKNQIITPKKAFK